MANFKTLLFNIDKRVATITLNRPNAANGMNLALTTELAMAASLCDKNADLKAVILTGSGRFFCAGGDINAMQSAELGAGVGVKQIADELHKALSIFARMNIPLICAVNGTAAGAGFSTAISADLVIASESAKFTMAYSNVGLSPDGSASYYLPRLVGVRKAQELMFTNRLLSAQEAMDWGLLTRVVADDKLIDEANTLAQSFVNGAKGSNASIKKLLLASFNNGLETQMELEGRAISANADSVDGREGVAAFLEKRKPNFS
jgi:2-(1,2-epoxy-1,2-dihydrophenyl)acetyl-CoA isomerase